MERESTIGRRRLLAITAGATAAIAAPALAQSQRTYRIRFSILPAENSPEYKAFTTFKEIVERDTNRGIEVQLFPNSQLGNERESTEQVRIGAVEMTSGGGDIQGFVPQVGLFYLPFLYPSDACFVRAWDIRTSPVARRVADLVLERTQTIRALSFMPSAGTRNVIVRNRPVRRFAEFRGVRIRVDSAPTSFATMRALGAAPVVLAFPEVYSALQTGVVDAAENLLTTFLAFRWAEVARFVAMTNHNRVLHVAMIHEPFYQSLPREFRAVVDQAGLAMAADWHDPGAAALAQTRAELERLGVRFHDIEDPQAWMEAAMPLQDEWARTNGFEAELRQVREICRA